MSDVVPIASKIATAKFLRWEEIRIKVRVGCVAMLTLTT
jgi:hypothetical protein